jgi:hypothetical protein
MRISLVLCCALLVLLAPVSAASATDLSGNWSGDWVSCSSGHKGPLRARFCRSDDPHYRVVFTGRFFRILPFRYTVTLHVISQEGDRVLLSGSQKLPFFGTFHYNAEATGQQFTATYCSRSDNGRFTLRRCDPAN